MMFLGPRWMVCSFLTALQYYEEIGKPTPKVEVMKYLKGKQYVDAKDFAGECEAVVVVAKGQGEIDQSQTIEASLGLRLSANSVG